MRIVMGMVLPLLLVAQSHGLKAFIDAAANTNGLIKAHELTIQAKQQEVEASRSDYWPTVDIGGDYTFQSPKHITNPGEIGNAYVTANLILYDGGRHGAKLRSKQFEKEASAFEKEAFSKSVTLSVVREYYTIKTIQATLQALREREVELNAQIKRVKKFLKAGLATGEDVDKLVAVYENNRYTIENTKLTLERSEENLALITGISSRALKRNTFREPHSVPLKYFDAIRAMQASASAVGESAEVVASGYHPTVSLSDTYRRSHFDGFVTAGGIGGDQFVLDHQNKLTLSVNMRLFDRGKIAKESEAVRYQKLALLSKIEHAKKEQKMNYKLAGISLKTTRAKLQSAKSAYKAAQSTYRVLRKKFEVGLVDNIAYLDALTQRTLASAQYQETLYDYEIKKSIYYYYAGRDPKEFIQ